MICLVFVIWAHFISSKKLLFTLIIPGKHWMSEWQLFPGYFILITILGHDVFVQLSNSVAIYENGGAVFVFGYFVADVCSRLILLLECYYCRRIL